MDSTPITHYFKSDFGFFLDLTDAEGNAIGFPSFDWKLTIHTAPGYGRRYTASCVAGRCTNCREVDGRIYIACDSHGLAPGELIGEFFSDVENALFADGKELTAAPFPLGITLSAHAGDLPKDFSVETAIPVVCLSLYEVAVARGYEGSSEDFMRALTRLPSLAEEADEHQKQLAQALSDAEEAISAVESQAKASISAAEAQANESMRGVQSQANESMQSVQSQATGSIQAAESLAAESIQAAESDASDAIAEAKSEALKAMEATRSSAVSDMGACRQEALEAMEGAREECSQAVSDARETLSQTVSDAQETLTQTVSQAQADVSAAVGDAQRATGSATAAAGEATRAAEAFAQTVVQTTGQATDKVMSQKAATEESARVEALVARLARDLAQYAEESPLTLSVAKSGKAIDTSGSLVSKTGYAVSAPVALKKGYTYLYRTADGAAVATGVALLARLVTKEEPVLIDYAFTYDEQGRPVLAVADYDSAVRYTYAYAEESDTPVITDASGAVVDDLPRSRVASAGSYVPMFKSLSSTLPESGYYAVTCPDDCEGVFSAPTPYQQVLVVSYGVFRSLINQKEDKAVVAQLEAKVKELAAEVPANTHDIDAIVSASSWGGELPLLCGQPMILFGEGSPAEATVPYNWRQFDPEGNPSGSLEEGTASTGYDWNGTPSALGQQYCDVSASPAGRYIAVRQSFDPEDVNYYTLIWKQC